jgi:hypothetical protein
MRGHSEEYVKKIVDIESGVVAVIVPFRRAVPKSKWLQNPADKA